MRGVILAAGSGRRLGSEGPKCMVRLGGVPLLQRQLASLHAAGIEEIAVVVGAYADEVVAPGCHRILNQRHAQTNMVVSLMCALPWIRGSDDDVLVTYGDLVFDDAVVAAACRAPAGAIATVVGRRWLELWRARFADPLDDAETLRLDEDDRIVEIGRRPTTLEEVQGQYVGVTRLSRKDFDTVADMVQWLKRTAVWDERLSMTEMLQLLIEDGACVSAILVERGWLEIDTPQDLALAEDVLAGRRLPGWMEHRAGRGAGPNTVRAPKQQPWPSAAGPRGF